MIIKSYHEEGAFETDTRLIGTLIIKYNLADYFGYLEEIYARNVVIDEEDIEEIHQEVAFNIRVEGLDPLDVSAYVVSAIEVYHGSELDRDFPGWREHYRDAKRWEQRKRYLI